MEILILDAIAGWVCSPENPGKEYSGTEGGALVSAVLTAVQQASQFTPAEQPDASEAVAALRTELLAGARDIADTPASLSAFVITLMPAVISELERRAGDPVNQLYWLYCYALLVLAAGPDGDLDHRLMPAIDSSFEGWNALMTRGFTLPWRAGSGSADILLESARPGATSRSS